MSKFRKIKQQQEEAKARGEVLEIGPTQERVSKFQVIKAAQQAAKDGVDMAAGPDQTVIAVVGSGNMTGVEQYLLNKEAAEEAAKTVIQVGQTLSQPNIVDADLITQNSNPSISPERMFEQLKAAMETDVQRLSTLNKLDEKAALKRELLPPYLDFVNDYMAQGHDYPNIVAVHVMIWLFDINDIEQAITLGLYLAKTSSQPMPARFKSNLVTFICDYTYDWAAKQIKAEQSSSPYLDQVVAQMQADKWSLSPVVEGKMYNRMAHNAFINKDYAGCVNWCDKAEQTNEKGHGTIKLKEKVIKAIEKGKTE